MVETADSQMADDLGVTIRLRGGRSHRPSNSPPERGAFPPPSPLSDPVDGLFREKRFCPTDRDAKFTTAFRTPLAEAGIEPVRLPPRLPNPNAWIERIMRSIKSECLDRMIFFGEDSLRRAVGEYLTTPSGITRDSATQSSRLCPLLRGRSGPCAVVSDSAGCSATTIETRGSVSSASIGLAVRR